MTSAPQLQAEQRRDLPELSLREAAFPAAGTGRSLIRRAWLLLAIGATLAALAAAGVGRHDVVKSQGAQQVKEFFAAALHPRLDREFLALTGRASLTTLAYAVLGTVLSLLIGLAAGVLCSRTWWRSGARGRRRPGAMAGWVAMRVLLVLPRGIHEVVWGLLFLSIFGLQPIVAVLAIGIPFGAVTAKVFSEILDETGTGPYSSLITAGAPRRTAVLYGLLPPALSDLLSYSFYRFECAIRSAAVLGIIGAGGLGFELRLSFQALRYTEIWTLLYALVALSAAVDVWSSAVRSRRRTSRRRIDGNHPGARRDRRGDQRRDRVLTGSVALAIALLGLSLWWVRPSLSVLWSRRTWQLTGQLIATSRPHLGPGGLTGLLEGSADTLAMSVIAIAVAFLTGLLLTLPAANLSQLDRSGARMARAGRLAVVMATRVVLVLLRAIPPPVWALLFLFVLFPGILPGALALGVYTAGVLGRLMAETAENIDTRPLRALRAHGASGLQVFCYGVVPPTIPRFVAYGLYRWEVTIRETVVVGVVGAGGLGLALNQQLASFDYGGAVTTLIALVVLTIVVDFTSAAIRRAVR